MTYFDLISNRRRVVDYDSSAKTHLDWHIFTRGWHVESVHKRGNKRKPVSHRGQQRRCIATCGRDKLTLEAPTIEESRATVIRLSMRGCEN